ncbi:hypothetical protein [Pseudomarimonas salicorniae]|uniref:Uncharacterized protein n=1 Tax=Pseudomarimonas salicorniae TaxID=2933270 RepID=A0ABT0GIT2_9GAMM|nr:hypothetical protein [Lysobacter sp. CAU 1642]MCK7594451.1 hypothetical protein [Lysobacter sp. CAU 1642]
MDLLCASQPTGRRLLQQAAKQPIPWQQSLLAVVLVEGLILMKLIARNDAPARLQDHVDIPTQLRGMPAPMRLEWLEQAVVGLGDRYAHELDNPLEQAAAPGPSAGPWGLRAHGAFAG